MSKLNDLIEDVANFAKDNVGILTAGAAGLGIGATAAVATTALSSGATLGGGSAPRRKKRKSTKNRKKPRRKVSRAHRKRSRRTPRTAGKGKDTSRRRIRHTCNGQPYIILRSGKARFIKKSSARSSRKRKGGRY